MDCVFDIKKRIKKVPKNLERENKSVYLCTRFKREGGMIRSVSNERIGSETF